MLDDISGVRSPPLYHSIKSHLPWSQVKTWDKVNVGMIKMYQAKVLGKLPATLFIWLHPPLQRASCEGPQKHSGHLHEGWGDCCGVLVPNAFAAAHEEGARQLRAMKGRGYDLSRLTDVERHNSIWVGSGRLLMKVVVGGESSRQYILLAPVGILMQVVF